ncbi:MAG: Nramp family divalent metal transporter [Acidobacteriota bacterium]
MLPATVARSRSSLLTRLKSLMKYLGPAFVISVAYIDPGNFGTNICGGSKFGYNLIWVILWSNLMAIFLQALSAKLGIATGRNLPQVCTDVFSRNANWFFWIVAEVAAIATNLAEFLGGVLGLYLLFHMPLIYAAIITGAATFFIAGMEKYGQRWVEAIIVCLVTVISGAYVIELFLAKPDWAAVGLHTLIPSLPNSEALLIAAGMLGATVMPHVIFLHSQLVQYRNGFTTEAQRIRHFRMETIDIVVAMNIAFIVNAAMVIVSASVFFAQGLQVETIEQAHRSLTPLLGSLSSAAFAIALLASGLSSSAVGTMAGETIMRGFIKLNIPATAAKLVNMLPAMIIIALGINPMKALLISQVVLSFALPAAIIPLMLITRRKDLMGVFVNKPFTNWAGWVITALILGLNGTLLYFTLNSVF